MRPLRELKLNAFDTPGSVTLITADTLLPGWQLDQSQPKGIGRARKILFELDVVTTQGIDWSGVRPAVRERIG